jgi:cytochrome bd-type quinol oxidase subunit 2
MGARLRRRSMATFVGLMIMLALLGSAWLAYATTSPSGSGSYPGTTTTTVQATTTTTVKSTTTTTTPNGQCKPGNGNGDKNHCHSGPPGGGHGSPHMRFIDVATSTSARWTIIAAGLLCLGLALVFQRRLRRL